MGIARQTQRPPRRTLLLVLAAAAAVALGGCAGSKSPPVADAKPKRTSSHSVTKPPNVPTKLVDEWAACERAHGNPGQTDPTIDAHGVIDITTPRLAPGHPAARPPVAGNPHGATGTCSWYLAAAQRALRAAHPVRDPQGVGQAAYLKYVACMRANGVPDYPSPEPNDPAATDFIGSGVNPNSPSVVRVNNLCGRKLGLPTWWIKGWGPPGDITVGPAGLPAPAPACAFERHGCGATLNPAP
jgi:hypothetical protein